MNWQDEVEHDRGAGAGQDEAHSLSGQRGTRSLG